ncbi:MAG: hypothetical protein RLZZ219_1585, partial [Cyanobacteriota bacterium]
MPAATRQTRPAAIGPIPRTPLLDLDLLAASRSLPELRQVLLHWWHRHGRQAIPWKLRPDGSSPDDGEALNPYPIWVAEVMLQQTQLRVMLPYWQRWMEVFPTLESLAAAEEHDVLLLWQGLGYYSRARRLQQGARSLLAGRSVTAPAATGAATSRTASIAAVVTTAGANDPWPRDLEGWLALPGIGRSTAGSILSSAFNQPHAILDGNVKRVLARLSASPRPPARDLAGLWKQSELLLDQQRPREFNQALMDLGATVCTPRQPRCGDCPWPAHCAAYAAGNPADYPVKDAPRELPFQVIGVGVVLNEAG